MGGPWVTMCLLLCATCVVVQEACGTALVFFLRFRRSPGCVAVGPGGRSLFVALASPPAWAAPHVLVRRGLAAQQDDQV
jgi:hypothetical protein